MTITLEDIGNTVASAFFIFAQNSLSVHHSINCDNYEDAVSLKQHRARIFAKLKT